MPQKSRKPAAEPLNTLGLSSALFCAIVNGLEMQPPFAAARGIVHLDFLPRDTARRGVRIVINTIRATVTRESL